MIVTRPLLSYFAFVTFLTVSGNVAFSQGNDLTPELDLTWNSVDPEENHTGIQVGDSVTFGASVDVENTSRFITEARLNVSVYRRGTLPDGTLGWLKDTEATITPPDTDLIASMATETLSSSSTFTPNVEGIYKVTATVSGKLAEDRLPNGWHWEAGNHQTHIFSVAPDGE